MKKKASGKAGGGKRGGGGKSVNMKSGNTNKKGFKGKGEGGQGQQKKFNRNKSDPLRGQWNLVPAGEELFSDKEFENLISFEELVEYDVVTNEDGTKEIHSGETKGNSKGRKRKLEELDEEDGIQDEEEEGEIPEVGADKNEKKMKKEKEKLKRKNLKQGVEESSSALINTSAGLVVVEEDENNVANEKRPKKPVSDNVSEKAKKSTRQKNGNRKKRSKEDPEPESVNEETGESGADENEDFEEIEWVKLGVPDIIVKSLKEKQFNKPTTIQSLTLAASILGKKDVVGAAETGSGKTLAFAIPIIDGILKIKSNPLSSEGDGESEIKEQSLKSLILTPTRELAVQVKNHFDVAAKYTGLKSVVVVGGLASQKQERLLRTQPDVVIATPGRLWELVQQGDPHLATLHQIRFLAIDETDRMVEKGHFQELLNILEVLNKNESYKESRQNFVFSATLSFTHEPPQRFKKIGNKKFKQQQPKKLSSKDKLKQIMEMVGVRPNPKIVDITTSKGTCEALIEMQISCSKDHKDYYLYYFLTCHPGRTIVFCNSINCVRRLTNLFFLLQCGEVLPLHSEMHQKMRLRNLERFTVNEKAILIATDVAARGLDIQNIEHVIHYEVPKTAESYIHRSGRTARAFNGGIAILMMEPGETTTVKNIFRSLERGEVLPTFSVDGKIFRDLKSRVEMAIKVEQFEHSVRKKLADHNWMEKAKKEMDLASSEDERSDDEGHGSQGQKKALMKAKKQLENYKQQLNQMLSSTVLLTNVNVPK